MTRTDTAMQSGQLHGGDPSIDLFRPLAIVGVITGHWLVTAAPARSVAEETRSGKPQGRTR